MKPTLDKPITRAMVGAGNQAWFVLMNRKGPTAPPRFSGQTKPRLLKGLSRDRIKTLLTELPFLPPKQAQLVGSFRRLYRVCLLESRHRD